MDSQPPAGEQPARKPFIQVPPGMRPPPAQRAAPRRPPPPPAPSGPPPVFKDFFESGLKALFSPAASFEELAARPAPQLADAAFAAAVWGVGASALALLVVEMRLPANAGLGVFSLLLGFVALSSACTAALLAGAGLFHGVSRVSGGKGEFDRSLQAMAHLAPLFPVAALIPWFSNPLLWLVPTLWATWIAVNAVEKLHDADSGLAWMTAGVLGLAVAGGQVLLREDVARLHFSVEDRLTIYAVDPESATRNSGESARTLQAPARAGRGAPPAMPENPMDVGGERPAAYNGSSLGMIRQPGEQTNLAGDPNLQLPQMPAQIPTDPAQLQQMGMELFKTVSTQLEANPDSVDQLPPEQRAMVKKYLEIAERAARGDVSAVRELDPEKIRSDSQKLMEYANSQGQPAPGRQP